MDCRPVGAAIGPGSKGASAAVGEPAGLDAESALGAGEPGSGPAVPSVVADGDPAGCVLAVDDADGVPGAADEVADGMAGVVDGMAEVVGGLEDVVGGLEDAVGGLEDAVAAAVVDSSLVVDSSAAT